MLGEQIDAAARAVGASSGRRAWLRAAGALAVGVAVGGLGSQGTGEAAKLPRNGSKVGRSAQKGTSRKDKSTTKSGQAFSRQCRNFILTGGPKRTSEFKHIDDDVFISLIPKDATRQTETLLDDHDHSANVNGRGDHVKPIKFDAKVGDQIRIVATNWQPPKCELDEVWIFCADGNGKGKKLLDHTRCSKKQGKKTGQLDGRFLNVTVRIKP